MATQVQFRRGTTTETNNFTGAIGEVTVDTTKNVSVVHDAIKAGGYPSMREDGGNSALVLGTVTNCSLKFLNDSGTGFYSPGSGQVAFATAGVQRLLIDTSGTIANSGGGFTGSNFVPTGASVPVNGLYSPGANQVALATAATQRLLIDSAGNITFSGDTALSGSSSAGSFIPTGATVPTKGLYSPGANQIALATASVQRLVIDALGRVGIGTATPLADLEVSTATGGRIRAGGALGSGFELNDANTRIDIPAANTLSVYTSNTERIRIDGTGIATFTGDVLLSSTGYLDLPTGTTGQRPGVPSSGMVRFNSTLTQFEGYNGAAWGQLGGGGTGGGGDTVFIENGQTVTTNYTLSTGKNAVSAGTVTINSGVVVTIPSGASWVIV